MSRPAGKGFLSAMKKQRERDHAPKCVVITEGLEPHHLLVVQQTNPDGFPIAVLTVVKDRVRRRKTTGSGYLHVSCTGVGYVEGGAQLRALAKALLEIAGTE